MAKKEIPDDELLTFEQAYAELEQIVATLEGSQSSLEESIKLFERGQALAERCARLLETAELKVKKLSTADEAEEPD